MEEQKRWRDELVKAALQTPKKEPKPKAEPEVDAATLPKNVLPGAEAEQPKAAEKKAPKKK